MNKEEFWFIENRIEGRKLWLDFLRGIAMLLVLWGHIDRTHRLFFILTSPFKIPLFFAITGYLFNDREGDVVVFVKKIFFSLVIPWFVLSLVWLKMLYALFRGRIAMIWEYFYDFISGDSFWFMPCIIVAEILMFILRKYIHKINYRYIAMVIICIFGLVLEYFGIGKFALFNVACVCQGYALFGYWFKNNEEEISQKAGFHLYGFCLIIYLILIIATMILYPGMTMDVHIGKYYSYLLCAALSFLGMLFLFTVSKNLSKLPRWIIFVGQNTLVFYMLQYAVRPVFSRTTFFLGLLTEKTTGRFCIEFIFSCVVLSIAAIIINKYMPVIVGKRKE